MEVRTILNHLRAGESNRRIAKDVGLDRRTVSRIRAWAKEEGLLEGELPEMGELQARMATLYADDGTPQNRSSVADYREVVVRLHREGVESAAIWERLKERGFKGSYSAVWRYVQKLDPSTPDVTVRVETEPGAEVAGRLWIRRQDDRSGNRQSCARVGPLS